MKKELRQAILGWDTVTWGRAVDFWDLDRLCPRAKDERGGIVLDIGSHRGGLTLLFALRGWRVCCSDLENPETLAKPLHQRYGVESRIVYRELDALKLDAVDTYDIICFKSVLGGVGYHDNYTAQQAMMKNIYRALKPGCCLFFVENTTASPLHRFLRRHFVSWGEDWRYVSLEEIGELCLPFQEVRQKSFGFLGCFGRTEGQRRFLGSIDVLLDRFLPDRAKYCVSVMARK